MDTVKIEVDQSELDEAFEKAERLQLIIKEARTILKELASSEVNLKVRSLIQH